MSALAWICTVCGEMTPRPSDAKTSPARLCTRCYGELAAVDLEADAARINELRNQATPICVEVEFYGREDRGVRYHLSTREIDLPARSHAQQMAFLLRDQLVKEGIRKGHHGIRRMRLVSRGA